MNALISSNNLMDGLVTIRRVTPTLSGIHKRNLIAATSLRTPAASNLARPIWAGNVQTTVTTPVPTPFFPKHARAVLTSGAAQARSARENARVNVWMTVSTPARTGLYQADVRAMPTTGVAPETCVAQPDAKSLPLLLLQ
jgi:hypothetical protein